MRKYICKVVESMALEKSFQQVLDEYAAKGWTLQDFRLDEKKIVVVFYKDFNK